MPERELDLEQSEIEKKAAHKLEDSKVKTWPASQQKEDTNQSTSRHIRSQTFKRKNSLVWLESDGPTLRHTIR